MLRDAQLDEGEAGERPHCADRERHFSELRHTSTKCALKQTVKATLVKQLGRIKSVFHLVFSEEQLCDSHALN